VGSCPSSVFRVVRFTSRPADQVFSLNPLASSYSHPETVPLSYVYVTPQSHAPVHSSFSSHLSPYNVKSEIFKLSLNKSRLLFTVRFVPYWQGFSTIRTDCYRRFQAPAASEHWLLLRNRRRYVAKAVNCVPGLILQIIMKLQVSVCDTVLR